MNVKFAEIIDDTVNATIVQLPDRARPAMCVQGDTLASLASIAYENAQIWLKNAGDERFPDDLLDSIVYLSNRLVSMALIYNDAMNRSFLQDQGFMKVDDLRLIELDEGD